MSYIDTIYVAAAAAVWGTLGIIASLLAARGYSPGEIAAFRVVISAAVIGAAALIFLRIDIRALMGCLPIAIAQSVFGVLLYNLAYFQSVEASGVTYAVCLLYTAPVWALFFSIWILEENFEWRKLGLALAALLGVVLVVYSGQSTQRVGAFGLSMGLASGACYALYPTLGQRLLRRIDSSTLLASSFGISAVVFVITPFFWQGAHRLWHHPAAWSWGLVLAISLFGTLFSYFLFTRGLRTVRSSAVAVITTIEPLTAMVLMAVFFGQTLDFPQYAGVALILAASIRSGQLGSRAAMRRAHAARQVRKNRN